jgi:hypothetical protein
MEKSNKITVGQGEILSSHGSECEDCCLLKRVPMLIGWFVGWLVDRYQHYGESCCFHHQGRINRQQTSLKYWCLFTKQQGVTSEKSNLHNERLILSRTFIQQLLIFSPQVT